MRSVHGAVLVLLIVASAQASHATVAETFLTPGWILLRVSDSATIRAMTYANVTGAGVVGAHLQLPGDSSSIQILTGGDDVNVATNHRAPWARVAMNNLRAEAGAGVSGATTAAHVLYYVATDAGSLKNWSWGLRVDAGASVEIVGVGDRALFFDGREATSGFHAHAAASGFGVTYSDMARIPFTIEHAFMGAAHPFPASTDSSTVRVTGGDYTQECWCKWWRTPLPAGDYVLEWDGHVLSAPGEGRPLLFAGVDVPGLT